MARIRFHASEHGTLVGLSLGSLFIAATFGVLALIFTPSGGADPIAGRVITFGLRETDYGSRSQAVVEADDRRFSVSLYQDHRCKVGDPILVTCVQRPWGKTCGGPGRCPTSPLP